jgi:hypothetical protein
MAVPEIGFSLCQILMAIKSTTDPDMGLFIAIDEVFQNGGYDVIFTAHKDRFEEANSLVPMLYILLEAKYGPRI